MSSSRLLGVVLAGGFVGGLIGVFYADKWRQESEVKHTLKKALILNHNNKIINKYLIFKWFKLWLVK